MNRWSITGIFLVVFLNYATSQLPPRIQIPGAISGARPAPFRPQTGPSPRLRRPNAIASAGAVRPVVEDVEEPNYPSPSPSSAFDEEVNKLSLSLQTSVRDDEEEYRYRSGSSERATPLPFRPERPVPIAREQIREKAIVSRPPPPPPRPVIRQELRQELRDDPIPVRQAPVRQQVSRPSAPVPVRKTPPRQQAFEDEEDLRERRRKPVSQILRKYRTDNEDGSITWGFENDDGTFKEETLGADCIIRGKYGYVDPDGVKREFSYETGNKCDEPDPEEEELVPQKQNLPQSKNRPLPYRPAPQPQFIN